MKTLQEETLELQAKWIVEERQKELKIVDDHNKMQQVRGGKHRFDEVPFTERKLLLLGRDSRNSKPIHGV